MELGLKLKIDKWTSTFLCPNQKWN